MKCQSSFPSHQKKHMVGALHLHKHAQDCCPKAVCFLVAFDDNTPSSSSSAATPHSFGDTHRSTRGRSVAITGATVCEEGETTKALTPRLDGGVQRGKGTGVENNILLHCATEEEQWANDSRATMPDRDEISRWTFSQPNVARRCGATAPAFLPQSIVSKEQLPQCANKKQSLAKFSLPWMQTQKGK